MNTSFVEEEPVEEDLSALESPSRVLSIAEKVTERALSQHASLSERISALFCTCFGRPRSWTSDTSVAATTGLRVVDGELTDIEMPATIKGFSNPFAFDNLNHLFSRLVVLSLRGHLMHGEAPLSNLPPGLRVLNLARDGSIGNGLGGLKSTVDFKRFPRSIEVIDLSDNSFCCCDRETGGGIDWRWIGENLVALRILKLGLNKFSGAVNFEPLQQQQQKKSQLECIDLSANDFCCSSSNSPLNLSHLGETITHLQLHQNPRLRCAVRDFTPESFLPKLDAPSRRFFAHIMLTKLTGMDGVLSKAPMPGDVFLRLVNPAATEAAAFEGEAAATAASAASNSAVDEIGHWRREAKLAQLSYLAAAKRIEVLEQQLEAEKKKNESIQDAFVQAERALREKLRQAEAKSDSNNNSNNSFTNHPSNFTVRNDFPFDRL